MRSIPFTLLSICSIPWILQGPEMQGLDGWDGFGYGVTILPDLNGDDCSDLAIGDPVPDPQSKTSGCVWLVSGVDASSIGCVRSEKSTGWFGQSVIPLEGTQGCALLAVSDVAGFSDTSLHEHLNRNGAGCVYVIDLKFNTRFRVDAGTLGATQPTGRFGVRLAPLSDLDQDGIADVLIAAPPRAWSERFGAAFVISSKDGGLLGYIRVSGGVPAFGGNVIAWVSNRRQYVACSAGVEADPNSVQVIVFELASKEKGPKSLEVREVFRLRGLVGHSPGATSFCVVGDIDADGHTDIAVGSPLQFSARKSADPVDQEYQIGRVLLVSGATGQVLQERSEQGRIGWFGSSIAVVRPVASSNPLRIVAAISQPPGRYGQEGLARTFALPGLAPVSTESLSECGGRTLGCFRFKGVDRLVSSRCDLDPAGYVGSVVIGDAGKMDKGIVVRRRNYAN